jgi:hypothetical protein
MSVARGTTVVHLTFVPPPSIVCMTCVHLSRLTAARALMFHSHEQGTAQYVQPGAQSQMAKIACPLSHQCTERSVTTYSIYSTPHSDRLPSCVQLLAANQFHTALKELHKKQMPSKGYWLHWQYKFKYKGRPAKCHSCEFLYRSHTKKS